MCREPAGCMCFLCVEAKLDFTPLLSPRRHFHFSPFCMLMQLNWIKRLLLLLLPALLSHCTSLRLPRSLLPCYYLSSLDDDSSSSFSSSSWRAAGLRPPPTSVCVLSWSVPAAALRLCLAYMAYADAPYIYARRPGQADLLFLPSVSVSALRRSSAEVTWEWSVLVHRVLPVNSQPG